MFSKLDNTRKNRPKTFVIAKKAFVEMFVSINLLGPKEMLLSFAQSMSKHHVVPYNVFFVVFPFR